MSHPTPQVSSYPPPNNYNYNYNNPAQESNQNNRNSSNSNDYTYNQGHGSYQNQVRGANVQRSSYHNSQLSTFPHPPPINVKHPPPFVNNPNPSADFNKMNYNYNGTQNCEPIVPMRPVRFNRPPPPINNMYRHPPPNHQFNGHNNEVPVQIDFHRQPVPYQNQPNNHLNQPQLKQNILPPYKSTHLNASLPSFDVSHPPPMVPPQAQTRPVLLQSQSCPDHGSQSQQAFLSFSQPYGPDGAQTYESDMAKKRSLGEKRLSSWLHTRDSGRERKKVSNEIEDRTLFNMKPTMYIHKLQTHIRLISDMSSQVEKLSTMISDADKISWQKECELMNLYKEKNKASQYLLDKDTVGKVKKKLSRIKEKKSRLRRSHHLRYQQKQEMEEARQLKEEEISKWQQNLLSEMKEELLKKKRKEEMDQTLSAVSKKIQDANRLIDTMTALEKLRLIRQDAAKKRGDADIGESRQSFEQKIADMTRLVQSQLEVYKDEEQQLRKVIKSEHEETTKKERQLQEKKVEEEQRQKDKDLQNILFGYSEDACPSDQLFPYQQFYKQAETSLPAFVQIRHEWDQFIVPADHPDGTTIPPEWIHPTDPSSSSWANALV